MKSYESKSIRTPHRIGLGPDEWFYWLLVVLVGSYPNVEWSKGSWSSWALFLSGGGIVPSGELTYRTDSNVYYTVIFLYKMNGE